MASRLFSLALVFGQICNHVDAAPLARSARSDMWTTHDFQWSCADDTSACTYDFIVEQDASNGSGPVPSHCRFTVEADVHDTASKKSFANMPCEQLTKYLCGGNWGSNGFFVLTVDDIGENRRAYFGFSDDEITSGQTSSPHSSLTYYISEGVVPGEEASPETFGTVEGTEEVSTPQDGTVDMATTDEESAGLDLYAAAEALLEGQESEKDIYGTADAILNSDSQDSVGEPVIVNGDDLSDPSGELIATTIEACPGGPVEVPTEVFAGAPAMGSSDPEASSSPATSLVDDTWAIKNLNRSVQYNPNSVHMDFQIDVLPAGPIDVPCTLQIAVAKFEDPAQASWYGEPCQESGWYLSWGYNVVDDSAVATLINPEKTREAWFGWDAVNSVLPETMLTDVGPSVVEDCDC